ncbi:probable E3 ubiquitin-protein ligase makorin-1 isoform X2 [Formica exsecta]|uniref:probable E3 ubiquitin-protein ligase makorin-1 isoform X2 n=1 Tax=Formica exsecta TaxID=72781 RepID=UPI001144C7B4|nr:probable E3 ubiquitin-protein ligase makorin-1 isoform X2 [Formica exsecta]
MERYFKNGACREGNNCRYRHVQASRNDANINETVTTNNPGYIVTCRFFKQGMCKFGNQCRFRHSSGTADSDVMQTNAIENSALGQHTANSSKNKKSDKRTAEDWVKAPEFVPTAVSPVAGSSSTDGTSASGISTSISKPVSYAQAVNPSGQASNLSLEPLCPYAEATGICRNINCTYLHGDICELCSRAVLHPHNEELRKKHTNACVKQHEADMELSFAIQRSKEKSCGVCFETIMEKSSREQRFGILPNCNHCFCLTCIRKWRQAKQFDNKIIRACPECRIPSDFVCPSMYWVDTKEEKEKLITDYKGALSTKDCKYFNKGRGKCPFGNKCFYLHALPDGTKKDVGPPVRQRRNTADTDIDILHRVLRLLMFWTMVVLEFLRYAWIRTTGLFIYGSQERRATTTVDEPNYERSFRLLSMAHTLRNRQRARLNVNSRHFHDIASL